MSELLFYDELNIVESAKAFLKNARSYRIERIKDKDGNMNDPLAQLKVSKPVIEELFGGLVIEMKRFKYQITMKVWLSKQKENVNREFTTVYFNSTTEFIDLLLISDENNSNYVYIKDFNRFMFNKTKHKNKKHFCRYCLCFSKEKVLIENQ